MLFVAPQPAVGDAQAEREEQEGAAQADRRGRRTKVSSPTVSDDIWVNSSRARVAIKLFWFYGSVIVEPNSLNLLNRSKTF